MADLAAGVSQWQLCYRLGWVEMRRRYRRTVIGPFWAALSMAIFSVAIGVVFSTLWKMDIAVYLPFLTSGLAAWIFVSTVMIEGCGVFVSAEGLLKQTPLPFSTFAFLNVWRNLIVFIHNMSVYLVVAIIFSVPVNANTLLVIPGILLFIVNGVWMTLLLGMLSSRYRDVQQVVGSLLQVAMLITPIFWPPEQIGNLRPFIVEPNIVYHFVNLIRSPLQGVAPEMFSWYVVIGMTVVGWGVTLILFGRFRQRIVFWL